MSATVNPIASGHSSSELDQVQIQIQPIVTIDGK